MGDIERSKRYDLTTKEGIAEIAKEGGLAYLLFVATGPIGVGAYVLYRLLSVDTEVRAAQDLIAQGRQEGVQRMRIKLSKKAAAKLGNAFEGQAILAEFDYGNDVDVSVVYK